MNVVGETVWACIYMGFPVLRIDDGQIDVWKNDLVDGAHDFLALDDFVGWVGGYGIEPERLTVARRSGDGTELHRFTETGDWYVLDLASLNL